jgi:hypothetical protein
MVPQSAQRKASRQSLICRYGELSKHQLLELNERAALRLRSQNRQTWSHSQWHCVRESPSREPDPATLLRPGRRLLHTLA